MKKEIMRAGVAVAAVGIAVAGAPSAFAGTDASAETAGAWGYFGAYGEHLNARDTNGTDNASARVQLLSGGAVVATIWASGGGATETMNLALAEGTPYTLKVCRVVKSTGYVYNCAYGSGTA